MTTNKWTLVLADEGETLALGQKLALACSEAAVIFLHGELGAGKTTLSRGIITALGHAGKVKSPTYTLVEPYQTPAWQIYHFDLYRLADPEELEYMGIRDYFTQDSLCLIEWPERGHGMLPPADMEITLSYEGMRRMALLEACTPVGVALLEKVQA
ncbi:tRNA (adenosine(37)-N6)-threonylcarbamoyltransferase complex ATPase subunit type 1 TsaE [Zobellella iuensis]|uniref:tRNA threonylcarbamoyladenosine biosynthesis protein TsaE n=1 Tax=Zobellella iuensis TaxID=2803811 RepID=A0ABS1QMC5_9GAMM|nr:tRNA (adenosine(37)-N6)-threonylcarbamoyltransferase complex ATPase subunit type 1 TsaE [Zobellella iuensis]MBL1376018.1 tRNA (adenosine(37)-N6)-threonylcarbamoyltransferase complex ATPase subunit type 1 TsaE [Zobellella iuensis]